MEKLQHKTLLFKFKIQIFFVGIFISFLIGEINDLWCFVFDEEFFIPFGITLVIYYLLVFTIGSSTISGFLSLKDWIRRAIIGGELIISVLLGFIIGWSEFTNHRFKFWYIEDILTPSAIVLTGIFVATSITMWVFDSYKNK